jgi:hypothetical protein
MAEDLLPIRTRFQSEIVLPNMGRLVGLIEERLGVAGS